MLASQIEQLIEICVGVVIDLANGNRYIIFPYIKEMIDNIDMNIE